MKTAFRFILGNLFAVVGISALLLIPCFWHTHIQAGDLGSHIYNAWLAQLAERHQIDGVVVVRQWNNVLFDLLLSGLAKWFGFVAAEKITVSLAVLIFFWGSFAFIAAISGKAPWILAPFLFVLAYGYTFHMGFMNFYLSVGLTFAALAAMEAGSAGNWLTAGALGALALVAHPLGFVVLVGVAIYLFVARSVRGLWRFVVFGLGVLAFVYLRQFFATRSEFDADWGNRRIVDLLGPDQLNLFGSRYCWLVISAAAWVLLGSVLAFYALRSREEKGPKVAILLAMELYLLSVIGTVCLPEKLRFSEYSTWVGLIGSRLTLASAVFGLAVLACARLPRWYFAGTVACAGLIFAFLYQDTGKLDQLEANARAQVQQLPIGTRIVAVAKAPPGWRVAFIQHSIERACVGHCFSYANYEPSSLQFRVRAVPGSTFVVDSNFKAEAIAKGDYVVQQRDLPLTSIYQCDAKDFTRLCAATLQAGQKTGNPK